MDPVDQLIHLFGGLRRCQRRLRMKNPSHLQSWQKTGRVPWWWELHVVTAARRYRIKLPPELMAKLFPPRTEAEAA